MRFDGELHRQFVHDFFGIAIDNEAHGVFDANTALTAVEELVLANLAGGGFVFDDGSRIADLHIRECVCAAFIAE